MLLICGFRLVKQRRKCIVFKIRVPFVFVSTEKNRTMKIFTTLFSMLLFGIAAANPNLRGFLGGSGGLGPTWTFDTTMEPPAGEKDMGGWTAAVYTAEQQKRLNVDQFGNVNGKDDTGPKKPSDVNGVIGMLGGSGGIGPAWTYDPTMEKPKGEKNMGSYTAAVYTKEQQKRLGVDENGVKIDKAVVVTAS